MPAKETTETEKESLNKLLHNTFVEWKRDKFDQYARSVERVEDKLEQVVAQGTMDPIFVEKVRTFLAAHMKLGSRVIKLEQAIGDSLKQTEANAQNWEEFADIKSDQVELKNEFAPVRTAIYKGESGTDQPAAGETTEGRPLTQSEGAEAIISRYALIATVVGLVPLPVLDILGIGAVQAKMLDELYKNYFPDDPADKAGFSKNFNQNLLTVVLGSFGAQYLFAGALGSAMKLIPVLGALPGGGALSVIAGTSTYVVGKLVKEQLEKGLTPVQVMEALKTVEKSKIAELKKLAGRVVRP